MPFTIDAYDVSPTFVHRDNPPWYHALIKHSGFQAGHGFIEYRVAFDEALKAQYEAAAAGSRFDIRPSRITWRLRADETSATRSTGASRTT